MHINYRRFVISKLGIDNTFNNWLNQASFTPIKNIRPPSKFMKTFSRGEKHLDLEKNSINLRLGTVVENHGGNY